MSKVNYIFNEIGHVYDDTPIYVSFFTGTGGNFIRNVIGMYLNQVDRVHISNNGSAHGFRKIYTEEPTTKITISHSVPSLEILQLHRSVLITFTVKNLESMYKLAYYKHFKPNLTQEKYNIMRGDSWEEQVKPDSLINLDYECTRDHIKTFNQVALDWLTLASNKKFDLTIEFDTIFNTEKNVLNLNNIIANFLSKEPREDVKQDILRYQELNKNLYFP